MLELIGELIELNLYKTLVHTTLEKVTQLHKKLDEIIIHY